jgi:hypothetical protein
MAEIEELLVVSSSPLFLSARLKRSWQGVILVPRALLTRGQPSATRGSGQIHIKLASDWPQRNIWFVVNMNKNTQALHEALVSLWRKLGEETLLKLKEQQYEAVRKIVVDNRIRFR